MSVLSNETLAACVYEKDVAGVNQQIALGVRANGFNHYDFAEQTRLYDTMVTLAVKADSMEILRVLVAAGFDVNESDDANHTPLMLAVERKNIEMSQFLIQSNADLNIQDSEGNSALMIAAKFGFTKLCELLLQAGADHSLISRGYWSDQKKQTAVQIAQSCNHIETATSIEKFVARLAKK